MNKKLSQNSVSHSIEKSTKVTMSLGSHEIEKICKGTPVSLGCDEIDKICKGTPVSLGCHAIQKSAKEPPCLCVLMQYRSLQSNTVFEFSFHPLEPQTLLSTSKPKKQKVVSPNGTKKHMHTHTHTHKTKKTQKKQNNKNKEAKVTLVKQLAKEY